MGDTYDLRRFVEAQDDHGTYARALAELRDGRKRTHWMWFIFPQLRGLGASAMAQAYGVVSLAEAQAYLAHPVLGPRLRECVAAVNGVAGRTAHEIFGSPDDWKFRSCLTLFAHATRDNADFLAAISKYYGGEYDPVSVEILNN